MHSEKQDSTKEAAQPATALSKNLRLAVPIASILMLILLATVVALPSGITSIYIPVYIFMVTVYVLASIYMFKTLMDKDRPSHA